MVCFISYLADVIMESITNLFAIEWEKLLTFLPKLAGALIVLLLFVFIGKSLAGAFSSCTEKAFQQPYS